MYCLIYANTICPLMKGIFKHKLVFVLLSVKNFNLSAQHPEWKGPQTLMKQRILFQNTLNIVS